MSALDFTTNTCDEENHAFKKCKKNTAEVTEHDHQGPSKRLQKSLLEVVKTQVILKKDERHRRLGNRVGAVEWRPSTFCALGHRRLVVVGNRYGPGVVGGVVV